MPLRLGALHDALLDAGANADLSGRAAEEVADYERRMADIRSDLRLLKWMVGFNLGVSMVILGILLNVLSRLPR